MIKTINKTIIKVLKLNCKAYKVKIDFVNKNIIAKDEDDKFIASYNLTKTRINSIECALNIFQLK